jgi:hypothetical protein
MAMIEMRKPRTSVAKWAVSSIIAILLAIIPPANWAPMKKIDTKVAIKRALSAFLLLVESSSS